jgi:squalene-hopene/tetraprenyl-beta-curcumene cyclase
MMAEGLITPEAKLGFGTAARRAPVAPPASLDARVADAVERSSAWLLAAQAPQGYWWGELEADTTLESDYILYQQILGRTEKIGKLANFIRRKQLPDGGWNIYPGGPSEINATVKAYFALKLAGDSPDAPHLASARQRVHELGGLEATNSYTRFYLAMTGALGWNLVPAIPPELMLLPRWFFVNLYEMSSWTRAIVIPLTILYALKPGWTVPEGARVDELFRDASRKASAFSWDARVFSWRNFFLAMDRVLKLYERSPWKPLRRPALASARSWLLEHLERSEGLATIYPAMLNSILALLALGYPAGDPLTAREIGFLEGYEIEEKDTLRVQPCISPVWDTAIAMVSLQEAGFDPSHHALVKAGNWLLDNQILGPGDWQVKNRDAEPGGWAFEFRNEFYPDVDDTAFVLMALAPVAVPDKKRLEAAMQRGLAWLASMQNRDGGWGAFDRDNDRAFLTHIPFADHNAMIDPATADVTARVVECFGRMGWSASNPAIERGREFLRRSQTAEGPWYGRWGSNYIYGTSGVLRALETLGLARGEDSRRAVEWLRSVQNPDGGFGESLNSYDDSKLMGQGPSTPSQTAWGLIGLLAASTPDDPAVLRAVHWLVEQQKSDGSWDESDFTGTGFPRVFYLKYHLYRNSFPLYALARYRNLRRGNAPAGNRMPAPSFEHHNGNGGTR